MSSHSAKGRGKAPRDGAALAKAIRSPTPDQPEQEERSIDDEAPFVIPSAEVAVDLSPLRTPERREQVDRYLDKLEPDPSLHQRIEGLIAWIDEQAQGWDRSLDNTVLTDAQRSVVRGRVLGLEAALSRLRPLLSSSTEGK